MPQRIDAVDFWRGVVLCVIFINHVPGNVFEFVTPRNFGFSDSAEAFVFLSGLSLALAYSGKIARGRTADVARAVARRAVLLYGVHIALSLAAIAIYGLGVAWTGDWSLMDVHGRDLFLEDPRAAIVGLFSLGHQIGYFNILPLYVLLLVFVPPMLWVGSRRPNLMLLGSVAIYAAARASGLNVPTWPMRGTWFFDPFAWQLVMAVGIWAGLALKSGGLRARWPLTVLAALVVAVGLAAVTDGFGLAPGLRDWCRTWLDLDKTSLGLGRVIHFIAAAYLIFALGATRWIRRVAPDAMLCRLGRHSLTIFALLSLLAALGQVLSDGQSPIVIAFLIMGGFVLLDLCAATLELRRADASRREAVAIGGR